MKTTQNSYKDTIYKVRDGLWASQIYLETTIPNKKNIKTFYGSTRLEVKHKLDEFKTNYKITGIIPSNEYFKDYIINWLKVYKKPNINQTTYDGIEGIVNNHIIPKLGHYKILEINEDILQEFFNRLKDTGYSYETIVKIKNILNQCLKQAVLKGYIIRNSMEGIKLPNSNSFPKKEISILNDNDIKKFVKEATRINSKGTPIYTYGNYFIFILYTGLRVGEALNLKWKDVDYKNKLVKITGTIVKVKNRNKQNDSEPNYILKSSTPKTANGVRTIPLCKAALEALTNIEALRKNHTKTDNIFLTSNNKIVDRKDMLRSIKNIAIKANLEIENCNLHTLRHTFASMLFRKGVDVKIVSILLGHSKVETTYNRYIHLIKEQKVDAIQVLEEM